MVDTDDRILVVVQPARKIDGLEAGRRRRAAFQLRVDLGGQLPGLILVACRPHLAASSVLTIAQVPHAAALINSHATDTKIFLLFCHGMAPRRESRRYKALQKALQTDVSGTIPEMQMPVIPLVRNHGRQEKRKLLDNVRIFFKSNPTWK
jgi:hypothetical protein